MNTATSNPGSNATSNADDTAKPSAGNAAQSNADNAAKSNDSGAKSSTDDTAKSNTDNTANAEKSDDNAEASGSRKPSPTSIVQRLKEMDEQRPSFPGEHWVVFAAGAYLMAKAARQRSFIAQSLMLAAGSALIGRAASGRDGLIKVASQVVGRRKF